MSGPRIVSVGQAYPEHYYDQQALTAALREHWAARHHNLERLEQLHRNVLVGGRHLALPIESYDELATFTDSNDAYLRVAVELGATAIERALERAGLEASGIDHVFFVTTTGLATPSVDARIVNRLGLRDDVKRSPLFGLGCAGGAVGISRAGDYLRAFPGETAVVLSVELCSLTLQRQDLSIPNIIASGLFGDGAAAVVVRGSESDPEPSAAAPSIVTTRSVFYPDTERIMGWDVSERGFQVVLSAGVPGLVESRIRSDVDGFLARRDLSLGDIDTFVCHPGGPKVLEGFRRALELTEDALAITADTLARVGNLSSASVLVVLDETLRSRVPPPGAYGLLVAMGPGFCSELVLLRW